MSEILLAVKHSWTMLHISRPLFLGSYVQVPCGLSANEKNYVLNDKTNLHVKNGKVCIKIKSSGKTT